jgi:hypothetical protein
MAASSSTDVWVDPAPAASADIELGVVVALPSRGCEEQQKDELQLWPHEELVYLEVHQDDCFVVHAVTLERLALPKGIQWDLVFDEEGEGCAIDVDDVADPVILSDALTRQLYATASDQAIVVESVPDGSKKEWSLSAKLQEGIDLAIEFGCGLLHLPYKCSISQFVWPRGNCRYFWKASDCYAWLGLKSYQGLPSQWVARMKKTWRKVIRCVDARNDHAVDSRLMLDGDAWYRKIRPPLDSLSLSTMGFLACVVSWAFATPRCGGFSDARASACAQEYLQGLLAATLSWQTFSLEIRFDDGWMHPWPCRESGPPSVSLFVANDLKVSVVAWREALSGHLQPVGRAWFAILSSALTLNDATNRVELVDILHVAASEGELRPLFGQLLVQVAFRIEMAIFKTLAKGCQADRAILASYVDVEALLAHPTKLDFELLKEVLSVKEATSGLTHDE